jgi:transposase-like protein
MGSSTLPEAAELLVRQGPYLLAFTAFLRAHWGRISSNVPQERVTSVLRETAALVGVFPDADGLLLLMARS